MLQAYPFDGQVARSWSWSPASNTQAKPTQIELGYGSTTFEEVADDGGGTYFALPHVTVTTRAEGSFKAVKGDSLLQYVAGAVPGPATVLSRTTTTVTEHDGYGNVLAQNVETDSVAETDEVTRTVVNDPTTWLIGEAQSEKACSTTGLVTQCRTTARGFNAYGEVDAVSIGDPADPGTQLSQGFEHDAWGNVWRTVTQDAFGDHRSACVTYEPDGIFPWAARNALGHTAYVGFDAGLGVKTAFLDANGLVTQWVHDGLGRVTEEMRPDGTSTTSSLARAKDGGPQGHWWNLKVTTQDSNGPSTTITLDGQGRPVKTVTTSAATTSCGANACKSGLTLEQDTQYDLFGRPTRVTVPWMVGDSLQGKYADGYAYDAAGRVTSHTEPWGRTTTFAYGNNVTTATDWLGPTSTKVDALGRTVTVTDKKGGTTETVYGPFSATWEVTRLGSETTYTTPDAYGRTIYERDPDRGETFTSFDGFGEVLTVDDALARHFVFDYDALGRVLQRDDTANGTTVYTDWSYDTAAHGIGRLATVTSPAGHVDSYGYDPLSRPSTHTLTLGDTGDSFTSTLDYDPLGRPWHLTYPDVPGVAPLTVRRAYDAFGNLTSLTDDATATTFWQLERLDGAGRASRESFGNYVGAQRAYSPSTGLVEQISASWGFIQPQVKLQDLSYGYDLGLRMLSRPDLLQPGTFGLGAVESFRHDALDRITCASFFQGLVPLGGAAPPCAQPIAYYPNGNIDTKGGGAAYTYDPSHPHAVATAGGGTFAYDAVGNQIARPGVTSIAYTPFDLPATYTLAGSKVVTLDYDGGQHRIRKTTPQQETVYFDDLYERVTSTAVGSTGGTVQHRYYVAAGSATVVVTREEGAVDEVAYLHTDALGSVDVITDGTGAVLQRRSYDAFGAERNPAWGQAPPVGGFTSAASPLGFTGQEADDDHELGLVNMRGRIYDPKVGRFLTTDPLVSRPGYTQSWNPYSYVWNSPLSFTDPSGFDEIGTYVTTGGTSGTFKVPRPTRNEATMEQQLGGAIDLARAGPSAGAAPDWNSAAKNAGKNDAVDGSAAGVPQAVREHSPFAPGGMGSVGAAAPGGGGDEEEGPTLGDRVYASKQVAGAFIAGVGLGLVPGGAGGHQVRVAGGAHDRGSLSAQSGSSFGARVGGAFLSAGGLTGDAAGVAATLTGVGAIGGVPASVVSTTALLGGFANVGAGARGLSQALMSKGSGGGREGWRRRAVWLPPENDRRELA